MQKGFPQAPLPTFRPQYKKKKISELWTHGEKITGISPQITSKV